VKADIFKSSVLLPDAAFDDAQQVPVRVIDWEMAQVGVRAEDVGQFIAELWLLKLYKNIDGALWIINGFTEGYGQADANFAYRVLIHIGAHLICFGSTTPGWGTSEQGQNIVKDGRDVLLNAWKMDARAFEGHDLECLFE
jgi:5-methylthioribose kinase